MEEQYTLQQQRETFYASLLNDLVLKEQDGHLKWFDQVGAGHKAFGKRWDNVFFRAVVNIALPFMMLGADLYCPLRDSIKLLLHKRIPLKSKRLFVGHGRQLYNISKRAELQKEDDVWLRMPSDSFVLPEQKSSLGIFDFLTYGEIFKSAFQGLLIHVATIIKLGYDKYFLSLNAYNWCLCDFTLRHVPVNVELVYSYICDRNAILIDRLPHRAKSMVQHGTMHFGGMFGNNPYKEFHEDRGFYLWKGLYRSSPTTVYCYTADDEWALSNSVIANKPLYVYIGYGFKPAYKPERKSVLIVANYFLFKDKEDFIIGQLQPLDIDIYLKNHPTHPNSLYDDMRSKYNFHFIEGVDTRLPDVDFLISYDSTLAYEYASIGTKVLYYGRFETEEISSIVKEMLNLS